MLGATRCMHAIKAMSLVLAVGSAASAADDLSLSELTPEQRIGLVVARLEARDRVLRNIAFAVQESHTNISVADGTRRFMFHDQYDEKRLGPQYWMHLRTYKFYNHADDIRADVTFNWDGATARSCGLIPSASATQTQCSVRDHENENFTRGYSEILGFRVKRHRRAMLAADWVQEAASEMKIIAVEQDVYKGRPHVYVKLVDLALVKELWLDPARDFMIAQVKQHYDMKKGYDRYVSEVIDAKEVDGLWVPMKVMQFAETSGSTESTEITYDVSSFTTGRVKEPDMAIEFPAGARVVDEVRRIAYFVGANGSYRLAPLANTQAGELRIVPKGATTRSIDQHAVDMYRTIPMGTHTAAPPMGWYAFRWWVIGTGALLLTLSAIRGYRRRRSRHAC